MISGQTELSSLAWRGCTVYEGFATIDSDGLWRLLLPDSGVKELVGVIEEYWVESQSHDCHHCPPTYITENNATLSKHLRFVVIIDAESAKQDLVLVVRKRSLQNVSSSSCD